MKNPFLGFASFFATALLSLGNAFAAERPNILWITAEDMSANLGCFGDRFAATPYLDEFAAQSVRYTRAFATAPVCAPSRACLISGVYATSLGNPHLRCDGIWPDGFRPYAAHLRDAGYFTSNNVKTDYNLANEAEVKAQAWNRCDGKAHWRQREAGQPFFSIFNLMETHQSRTSVWSWDEFEKLADERLSPGERANPDSVPVPPFYEDTPLTRRAMARYYDCVQIMDKEAGRILRELEQDGLAEDTIVFFYSDHGMGMPRGKRVLHDSGMHVPLLIRFPKKFQHLAPAKPGETLDRLVSFVDFPPTLLSLLGLPIPAYWQGVPFLGPNAGPRREFIYGARDRVDEVYDTARSIRDGRWLYLRNYVPHLPWAQPEGYSDQSDFRRALIQLGREGKLSPAAHSYVAAPRPLEEFYDTQADPHQLRNLAGEPKHQAQIASLRAKLRQWLLDTRDLGFIPEQQLRDHTGGLAPYAWARHADHYDLESILGAAELVGRPDAVPEQTRLLAHPNDTVRYWAAMGLRAAGPGARAARAQLEESLDDSSASVRLEVAGALVALDEEASPRALETLRRALIGSDLEVALHAARTLQLLGPKARPLQPVMEKFASQLDRVRNRDSALYLGFALKAALSELQQPPAP